MLVGLGLSLVSDTSGRPGHQKVMLFRTKKQLFSDFCNSAHFRQKWTHGAGRRRTPKISSPPDRILGPADMGGGGGDKILVGRRFSLEKRSERPWPLWGRGELLQLGDIKVGVDDYGPFQN